MYFTHCGLLYLMPLRAGTKLGDWNFWDIFNWTTSASWSFEVGLKIWVRQLPPLLEHTSPNLVSGKSCGLIYSELARVDKSILARSPSQESKAAKRLRSSPINLTMLHFCCSATTATTGQNHHQIFSDNQNHHRCSRIIIILVVLFWFGKKRASSGIHLGWSIWIFLDKRHSEITQTVTFLANLSRFFESTFISKERLQIFRFVMNNYFVLFGVEVI